MPGVLPVYGDADGVTQTTSAAVVGGQCLALTGDRTVAPTAGATDAFAGVALYDQAVVGQPVAVCIEGTWLLTAASAITAGQKVITAAAGHVAPYVPATNTPDQIIGTCWAGAAATAQALVHLT